MSQLVSTSFMPEYFSRRRNHSQNVNDSLPIVGRGSFTTRDDIWVETMGSYYGIMRAA